MGEIKKSGHGIPERTDQEDYARLGKEASITRGERSAYKICCASYSYVPYGLFSFPHGPVQGD